MTQVADHTYLSTLLDCPRKFYYRYVRHLESPTPSLPLVVGSAGHKAMEVLYGPDGFDAIDAAVDAALEYVERSGLLLPPSGKYDFVTEGHIEVVLRNYVDAYRHIEPYKAVHQIEEPLTSSTLGIGGIPDLVVEDQNGHKLVLDHKFKFSYISEWTKTKDKMGKQGPIYCLLASEKYGEPINTVVFNYVFMGKGASSSTSKATMWDREILSFDEAQLREAELWISRLKGIIKNTYYSHIVNMDYNWPQNASSFCSFCSYQDLCKSSPDVREDMIEREYVVREPQGVLLSGADDD